MPFTVGSTRVVDVASGIPQHLAIDIIAVIEGQNGGIALGEAARTFVFGHLLAEIRKKTGPWLDRLRRKASSASNTGFPHPNMNLHHKIPLVFSDVLPALEQRDSTAKIAAEMWDEARFSLAWQTGF